MNNISYQEDELKNAFLTYRKINTSNDYQSLNLPKVLSRDIKLEDFFIVDENYINNNNEFYIKKNLMPKLKNLDYFIAVNNYPTFNELTTQIKKDLHRTIKFIYKNNQRINPPNLDEVNIENNLNVFNTFFLNQPVFKTIPLSVSEQYKYILEIDIITTQQVFNFIHASFISFLESKWMNFNAAVFPYQSKKPRQYCEYFLTDNNISVVCNYNGVIVNRDDPQAPPLGGIKIKLICDLTNNTYSCDFYAEYKKDGTLYNLNHLNNALNENTFNVKSFTDNLDIQTCVGCGIGSSGLFGTLLLTGILGGKNYKHTNKNSKIKKMKVKNLKSKKLNIQKTKKSKNKKFKNSKNIKSKNIKSKKYKIQKT